MSPESFALVGVLLGAALAGAANLLLTWRQETREAQAGVGVVVGLLSLFEQSLEPLVDASSGSLQEENDGEDSPTWWLPGSFPSADPWKPYRQALLNRLPAELVERIDAAMAEVELLDQTAAFRHERNNDIVARWWTALTDTANQEQLTPRAQEIVGQLEESAKADDWIRLDPADLAQLRDAVAEFKEIREELESGYSEGTITNRVRWHWRPATVLLPAMALGAVLLVWALSYETDAGQVDDVEESLATEVAGESLTTCQPIKDRGRTFDCLVIFQANRQACPRSDTGSGGNVLAETARAASDRCGSGDTSVTEVARFTASMARGQNCTLFAMTQTVRPRSSGKKRRRTPLQTGDRVGSIARGGELPSALVPDRTFVTCRR